jgi:hypothetical protein
MIISQLFFINNRLIGKQSRGGWRKMRGYGGSALCSHAFFLNGGQNINDAAASSSFRPFRMVVVRVVVRHDCMVPNLPSPRRRDEPARHAFDDDDRQTYTRVHYSVADSSHDE